MANIDDFPSMDEYREMRYLPIFFEPIEGSHERILVAVQVESDFGKAYSIVNRVDKFRCLFGRQSISVLKLIDALEQEILNQLDLGLDEGQYAGRFTFSCFKVGAVQQIQALDERDLSSFILGQNSLLYDEGYFQNQKKIKMDKKLEVSRKNLGNTIFKIVTEREIEFTNRFSRNNARRKNDGYSYTNDGQVVDFYGQNFAANFTYFGPGRYSTNYKNAQVKMLELNFARERRRQMERASEHELMIYRPSQIIGEDEAKFSNDAMKVLGERADTLELVLRSYGSAEAIGQRVVERENVTI